MHCINKENNLLVSHTHIKVIFVYEVSDVRYLILQDDEINLQCQLVEKLKQQMLDQDEVRKHKLIRTYTYTAHANMF